MTTPEGQVKNAIKKELDHLGCYYFMPVQTGLGKRTLDFLVCFRGLFYGIEAKRPGEKPTALQEKCIRDIRKAGGDCIVIDSVQLTAHLPRWLASHSAATLDEKNPY